MFSLKVIICNEFMLFKWFLRISSGFQVFYGRGMHGCAIGKGLWNYGGGGAGASEGSFWLHAAFLGGL